MSHFSEKNIGAPGRFLSVSNEEHNRNPEGRDMTAGHLHGLLHRLRRTWSREDRERIDSQLLEGFLNQQDEAAFQTLVQRHGPMVLGVCRRVLGHLQDAEDAFQATFLVLARKAATLQRRELLGNWLYGVAYRAALEAKAARQRVREQPMGTLPDQEAAVPTEPQPDLHTLLDQELNNLPEKYRTALVLCDLEGLPRREAARRLGVPLGTLSGRLTTARRHLARRLARLGLTASTTLLAAALSEGATAGVPPRLVAATLQALRGPVSAPVAALTRGVLLTMILAKLQRCMVALLLLVTFTWGLFLAACPTPAVASPLPPVTRSASVPVTAPLPDDPRPVDAKQVLHLSAAACRQVQYIEYIEEQATIAAGDPPPFTVAHIRQSRAHVPDAGFTPGKFLIQGENRRQGQPTEKFAFAYDGTTLRILESWERQVMVVASPTAGIAASLFGGNALTGMPQFSQEKPFQIFFENGVRFEHVGLRTIKQTPCHVIRVTHILDHPIHGKQRSTVIWFIGRDDHLPRGNEIGPIRKTIQILTTAVPAAPVEYTFRTPVGYTEKAVTGQESQQQALLLWEVLPGAANLLPGGNTKSE
jgi:RNA polymerase sigma factor (sigma-70 family)